MMKSVLLSSVKREGNHKDCSDMNESEFWFQRLLEYE